jgi:hypothetical protein
MLTLLLQCHEAVVKNSHSSSAAACLNLQLHSPRVFGYLHHSATPQLYTHMLRCICTVRRTQCRYMLEALPSALVTSAGEVS